MPAIRFKLSARVFPACRSSSWAEARLALRSPTLTADNNVFVIDHTPEVADRFEPLDVQFVLGAATSRDVLIRADVERADFLVACTGLDEVNIVSCAMARQIGHPADHLLRVAGRFSATRGARPRRIRY